MSNLRRVQDLYAAFGRGDVPAVLASFDASIAWHEAESSPLNPSDEAWIGPEAVLQNLFVQLGEEWDGFAVHPEVFHDAGDTVVVEGRYTGTCKATGKPLDAQLCHVWTFHDGKAAKFQQYTDTAQFRTVMGA